MYLKFPDFTKTKGSSYPAIPVWKKCFWRLAAWLSATFSLQTFISGKEQGIGVAH